jgi:hypothetical protein
MFGNKYYLLIAFLLIGFSGTAQLNQEQQTIKKVFFDFLHYYQRNENKFNSFHLHKGTGKESGPPYKIQWAEVERYVTYLRKNVPYVGETYIANERKDFKFYDSCFIDDPTDEMPVGFDFDRWGGGQESVEYLVKWHTNKDNIYQVKIDGNKAELRIGSPLWKGSQEKDRLWSKVPFIKEKGRWVMAGNVESIDEGDQ